MYRTVPIKNTILYCYRLERKIIISYYCVISQTFVVHDMKIIITIDPER